MRLIRLVTHLPRRALLLVLLATLTFAALIPRLHIDTDPENMLPEDQPARVFHNQVKERFDLHDTLVVGAVNEEGIFNLRSLTALNRLTEQILTLEGVVERDLLALSTVDNIHQSAPGTLAFAWMMKQAPENTGQARRVREAVARLPLLHNTLVSADGRAAAIYVPLEHKKESYRIAEQIRALLPALESDDAYHITGLPVAEDQFGSEMFVQMAITAPLAGLVIFALLWLMFRNAVLVVAPMLVAMATVIITMGALVGLGFSVHIMSSMIAIFLMPIAVVDSVHLLSEFADRYRPGRPLREVIDELFTTLFRPMLFTTLSSAAGFASLLLTPIPPVQIFGAFIAFGILLAFVLTLIIVPAYIVLMSPPRLAALQKLHHGDDSRGAIARGVRALGNLTRARPRRLLALFVVLGALGISGLSQLQVNDNPVRWFKSDHEIPVADRTLNRHFAGTYNAYLVLESEGADRAHALAEKIEAVADEAIRAGIEPPGYRPPAPPETGLAAYLREQLQAIDDRLFTAPDSQRPYLEALLAVLEREQLAQQRFLDPGLLSYLDGLQRHLEARGLVGKSHSLSDLVMTLNREFSSGETRDYRLPDSAPAVSQLLMQYQSSHRPQDLWHLVTPGYASALIWLQLPSGDNQAVARVVKAVNDYRQAHPLPEGLTLNWAGKAYLNLEWQQAMVNGMLESLLSAFAVVALMMLLLFRSPGFALLAMLPLTLTITLIYGLIGWLGKDYDMPIAVLSALTLGLSVDFAIHFVERLRALMARHSDIERALDALFEEPARAIARNALVIALGFTPLLLAPLVPYITVGLFMAAIMAISALVTLLLLPILVRRLAPWLFALPSSPAGALP